MRCAKASFIHHHPLSTGVFISLPWRRPIQSTEQKRLVGERVLAGTPPGQEDGETDGLENACEGTDGDLLERALLGGDLSDDLHIHPSATVYNG